MKSVKSFDEMDSSDFTFHLFRQFCTYLTTATYLDDDDKLLAPTTGPTLLSGVKTKLSFKYPNHAILKDAGSADDWLTLAYRLTRSLVDLATFSSVFL